MQSNQIAITLDVDWAPDFVIDYVAGLLIGAGVKTTWFVTHSSQAIQNLRENPALFELGIHPNFFAGSTHGHTAPEILRHCMDVVPEAVSMRSHGVYQSGPLYGEILTNTPIRLECSTFLPEMEHIHILDQATQNGVLRRVPFFWADDYELSKEKPEWNFNRFENHVGIQVFMFHPIHIYLNTCSMDNYGGVKKRINNLSQAKHHELKGYANIGNGIGMLFEKLLSQYEKTGAPKKMNELI